MSQQEIQLGRRGLIRLLDDGSVDEIVLKDENGDCVFHLEQMDGNLYWSRIYSTKAAPLSKDCVINFYSKKPISTNYELEPTTPTATDDHP